MVKDRIIGGLTRPLAVIECIILLQTLVSALFILLSHRITPNSGDSYLVDLFNDTPALVLYSIIMAVAVIVTLSGVYFDMLQLHSVGLFTIVMGKLYVFIITLVASDFGSHSIGTAALMLIALLLWSRVRGRAHGYLY